MRYSLEGKLTLWFVAVVIVAVIAALASYAWLQHWVAAALLAFLVVIPVAVYLSKVAARPLVSTIAAINDGIVSIRDRDFSISITARTQDELGTLVENYNGLGARLREERQGLYQRELLLDTVIQATPIAIVLTNANDRVIYSNLAARQMFLSGRKLEGLSFIELLQDSPDPLRQAAAREGDSLFTIEGEGESEIYHLSKRDFRLNGQAHRLFLLKQMTRELSRQEVDTWKKVIRVIAHELNNSLAPISSLAHSGRQVAARINASHLDRIFNTIEDRAKHLHTFIDGYARFAKLPRPRVEEVDWHAFLRSLQQTMPFRLQSDPPMHAGVFDAAQLEQVIINLVKNAREAGAPDDSVEVDVREQAGGWQIQVCDRGAGMTDEVLRNALLPFYSTKASGAGLGLTLCREVVEAHGGRMSLANREGGGLIATLWLPKIESSELTSIQE